MKRFIILFVLFACSILAHDAWACDCAGPGTPKQEFDKVKAVFAAHVDLLKESKQGYVEKVILKIDKIWKGSPDETFAVAFPSSGCAFWNFEYNKSYLIYAHASWDKNDPDGYEISMCSRTKPLDHGQIETRYLDAIVAGKDTKVIDQSLPHILTNKKEENNIRAEAARLVGRMIRLNDDEAPEGSVEALINASESDNTLLKTTIIFELANTSFKGRSDVKKALLRLLKDKDFDVRDGAVEAIPTAVAYEPKVFQALVQTLSGERKKQWKNVIAYKQTIAHLGISISKMANTLEEKIITVDLLHTMLDEISDPYYKALVIQRLGFLNEYAYKTVAKLRAVLKATDHGHVKQYTISALADIKATEALEDIKRELKNENCYVVKHTIEAVYKLDPGGFPEFFRNKAIFQLKSRFEKCKHEFIRMLREIGPNAKDMQPFLLDIYKSMPADNSVKAQLKSVLNALH